MDNECAIDESNLTVLKTLTSQLRFSNVMEENTSKQIKTDVGTAYITGLLKVEEIAVTDNYAGSKTNFPAHQHPGHEIFIVYEGEMHLEVNGQKVVLSTETRPLYYFNARNRHKAHFPVECKYIAVTIPGDKDWPNGR